MLILAAKCRTMNTFCWKEELHVALELNSLLLNFIVLDRKFYIYIYIYIYYIRKKLLIMKHQI